MVVSIVVLCCGCGCVLCCGCGCVCDCVFVAVVCDCVFVDVFAVVLVAVCL